MDRCLLCWLHLLEVIGVGVQRVVVAQSVAPRRSLISNQAAIAQLGERQTEDLKVPSSILDLGICVARCTDDFVPTYSGSRLSCRVLSGLQNFSRTSAQIHLFAFH